MVLQEVEIQLEIQLDGKKEAQIIYEALKPEIESSHASRTRSWVQINDNKLILEVQARDSTSLRATVNSYLRWINLSCQILELN
jgi:KEOPS complex subunit Pcc1